MPSYVPQQIEDPTPTTAQASTQDPLAAAGKSKKRNNSFESEVRSPGGGSIRTGGPDLLNAILGHMESLDEGDDEDGKSVDTAVLLGEESAKEEVEAEEQHQPEEASGAKSAGDEDIEADEDDAETMEKIELPDRTKADAGGTADETAEGSGLSEKPTPAEPEKAEERSAETNAMPDEKHEEEEEAKENKPEDLSTEQKEAPAGVA